VVSAKRGVDALIDNVHGRFNGLTIGDQLRFDLSAMWRKTPIAIAGVLNERERREIGAAVDAVERGLASARAAQAAAKTQTGAAGKKLKGEADFTVLRLGRLNEICRLGETMLNMLLGQLTLDVGQFRHLLRVDGPPAATGGPETPVTSPPAAARPAAAAKEKRHRR